MAAVNSGVMASKVPTFPTHSMRAPNPSFGGKLSAGHGFLRKKSKVRSIHDGVCGLTRHDDEESFVTDQISRLLGLIISYRFRTSRLLAFG